MDNEVDYEKYMTKHFYIISIDAKKRIQLTDQRRSGSDMLHAPRSGYRLLVVQKQETRREKL